ncbi:hypothetical protein [Geobacillus sp. C56-T2]|uniref:hypothetical protein n=1 Tax=Geobacillus sp. C56-T2 TaxID=600773 RepID=UPI00119FEA1F|nr:hypothetical protein [Geobacillus sp. C56-T2]NNV06982.1 hypothetical protein [Geobacillus sp. MMMUD3]TWG29182.1 hypothetical protein GC56T2_0187 [Geobacillus sp. C56-T2]
MTQLDNLSNIYTDLPPNVPKPVIFSCPKRGLISMLLNLFSAFIDGFFDKKAGSLFSEKKKKATRCLKKGCF